MKTMEFNKIFGAATAALLIFLLAGFVSRSVYTISEPSTPGFALEVASADASADAESAAPAGEEDFATLLAAADPSGGPAIFRRCSACHKVEDGANGVGPHLYGVVGRAVGSVDGFRYSGALNAAAEVWGFEELNGFLTNPRGYAAGTSMGFAGLSNPRERATIIAWLNAQGPSPLPLPTPVAAVVEAAPVVAAAPVEEVAEAEAAEEVAATEEAQAAEVASAEPAAPAPAAPAPAPAAAPDALFVALSKADPARGASLYATCALCHTLDEGRHGIAPSLYGVIGREVASIPRFPYSAALSAAGGVWSVERLDAYLAAPADMGGHAGLPGLADAQARADILTHVNAAVPGAAPLAQPAPAVVEEDIAAAPADSVVEAPAEAVVEAPAEVAAEAVAEAPAEAPAAEAVAAAPAEVAAPGTAEPEVAASEATPEALAEAPAEAVEEKVAEAPAAEEETVVAAAAPAEEPAAAPAAAGSDDPFVVAYLAATAADGQRQFRKCSACHRIEEGRNGVGPSLWNVVGRDIGAVAGFAYSNALKGKGGAWSFENLNGFLENPKDWAPGTKMAFAGLKTIEERAAVIRYLNEAGSNPLPIQ